MRFTGRETIEVLARFVVAAAAVVLLPTMFLGAAFPAAARLVAGAAHVGRDVGTVAAVNTAGGIAGSLLTGFVLVPRLGLVRSIGALAVAGAVLGAIAILKGGRGGRAPAAWRDRDGARRRHPGRAHAARPAGHAVGGEARRAAALLRGGCRRHGGGPRAIGGPGRPSDGCTSRASRTPATRRPRCATCACRRCCRSSSTAASRARRSWWASAPASPRGRSSPSRGSRGGWSSSSCPRWCGPGRSSRATSARRRTPVSRSASATGGRSCCAGPSATT